MPVPPDPLGLALGVLALLTPLLLLPGLAGGAAGNLALAPDDPAAPAP